MQNSKSYGLIDNLTFSSITTKGLPVVGTVDPVNPIIQNLTMIRTNKINYFKAGQTYSDAIWAIILLSCIFLPIIVILFCKTSGSLMILLESILCVVYVNEMYTQIKQYSHSKKIIISKNGICIIKKKRKSIIKEFYGWDVITDVKLDYSHYVRGGAYWLILSVRSYSARMTGVKITDRTEVVLLNDYLSFFEYDSIAKHVMPIWREYLMKTQLKRICSKGNIADIDRILSGLCDANHKDYIAQTINEC